MKYVITLSALFFSSPLFAQSPLDLINQFMGGQGMQIPKEIEQQLQNSEGIKALQTLSELSGSEKILPKEVQSFIQQSGRQELLQKALQSSEAKKLIEKAQQLSGENMKELLSGSKKSQSSTTGNTNSQRINDPLSSFKNQIKTLTQTRLKILQENLSQKIKNTRNKKLQQQLQEMQKHVQSLIKTY